MRIPFQSTSSATPYDPRWYLPLHRNPLLGEELHYFRPFLLRQQSRRFRIKSLVSDISLSWIYTTIEITSSWHPKHSMSPDVLVNTGIISYQCELVWWSHQRPIRKSNHDSGFLLAGQCADKDLRDGTLSEEVGLVCGYDRSSS